MSEERLSELRQELADLDREIIATVARRRDVALDIGRTKEALGRTTRDFQQEKEVMQRTRRYAEECGLPEKVCGELLSQLIGISLEVQEKDRIVSLGGGEGKRVLIIGGAGRMGRWFSRYLASQGYNVEISDPAGGDTEYRNVGDWKSVELNHDLVVVSVSLGNTASVLEELLIHKPTGIVFDVGSLKSPQKDVLGRLQQAGVKVTSVHPMFGPSTELLSGRHIVFVDVGCREATDEARNLFANTMVSQVEMTLEEHDRIISFVLGLSHALNITFFSVLDECRESLPQLAATSSTTFDAQLSIARQVASENPNMYYGIQALNESGGVALDHMVRVANHIRDVVANRDEEGFVELMKRGEEMFENWEGK